MKIVTFGGGHGMAAVIKSLCTGDSEHDITGIATGTDSSGTSKLLADQAGTAVLGDTFRGLDAMARRPLLKDPRQLTLASAGLLLKEEMQRSLCRTIPRRHAKLTIPATRLETYLRLGLGEDGDNTAVDPTRIPEVLDELASEHGCQGRVYPAILTPSRFCCRTMGPIEFGSEAGFLIGVQALETWDPPHNDPAYRTVERAWIEATSPAGIVPVTQHTDVASRIQGADLLILGPGDLYPSVLAASGLVAAIRDAIQQRSSHCLMILNAERRRGHIEGTLGQFVDVFNGYGISFDSVLVPNPLDGQTRPIAVTAEDEEDLDIDIVRANLFAPGTDPDRPRYSPELLGTALREILASQPAT